MAVADTMRVLRPGPNILGFYDGRVEGQRLHSDRPNWLDDGGYVLGTCSYAIVDGPEALVYDTHITLAHARRIRAVLEAEGVRSIRVVLSHHHKDHIAGNAVFADCEILANAATAAAMAETREEVERGDPPIRPVVMPTRVFGSDLSLTVGRVPVELRSFDIHSRDGLVAWLPQTGALLAGDTLEDPVTYVCEPDRLEAHLRDLDRMAQMPIRHILPNHGDPEVIASGGFGPGLISATKDYVTALLACRADPARAVPDLMTFIAPGLAHGSLRYHPAYEAVHQANLKAVLGG